VTDEVHDQRGVEATPILLLGAEAHRAHILAEEVRRLLGVEQRDDDVAGSGRSAQRRGSRQRDRHGRGVVVGAGCGDDAVVMGAEHDG
jgi:hypothetical protein